MNEAWQRDVSLGEVYGRLFHGMEMAESWGRSPLRKRFCNESNVLVRGILQRIVCFMCGCRRFVSDLLMGRMFIRVFSANDFAMNRMILVRGIAVSHAILQEIGCFMCGGSPLHKRFLNESDVYSGIAGLGILKTRSNE